MSLSGQNSPPIPNARHNWTTRHTPKICMVTIPNSENPLYWNVTEALKRDYESYRESDGTGEAVGGTAGFQFIGLTGLIFVVSASAACGR
jgi:hypothetical protein